MSTSTPSASQLPMRLLGHARLAEAGDDVDAVASRGSRVRASSRTSVSSPPTTSQAKTNRMRIGSAGFDHRPNLKTICRKSGRCSTSVVEEGRRVVERHDMGDHLARGSPRRRRCSRPIVSAASRRRSQRCARPRGTRLIWAQRMVEAVVVELLAEPQRVGAALVEGEVDHRALRPQRPQRGVQAVRMGARLEDEVGAAIAAAMVPARLGMLPGLLLVHRRRGRAPRPCRGGRPMDRR